MFLKNWFCLHHQESALRNFEKNNMLLLVAPKGSPRDQLKQRVQPCSYSQQTSDRITQPFVTAHQLCVDLAFVALTVFDFVQEHLTRIDG